MAEPIQSPDGKLEIIRHSMVYPTMGPKSIQEAVKNLSSAPVNAEIKAEFCDDAENPLGQSVGVFKDIASECLVIRCLGREATQHVRG